MSNCSQSENQSVGRFDMLAKLPVHIDRHFAVLPALARRLSESFSVSPLWAAMTRLLYIGYTFQVSERNENRRIDSNLKGT